MPIKSDLYCKTHGKKLSEKAGRLHYKGGCDVWYIDSTSGKLTRPYGKKKEEEGKPQAKGLGQDGAGIEEHVAGFEEPAAETLFIYHRGGKVERLWDRFPEHQSIYRALVEGNYFQGSPAEFIEASARFMLAAAGYEAVPCIIPTDMRPAYDETARLINEGLLTAVWEDGVMKLEINQKEEGSHDGDNPTQEGVRTGDNSDQLEQVPPGGGKEKKPSQAEQ